jgi:FtsZ-binding cell division protein ZapB
MASFDEARQRFESAVDRLEATVARTDAPSAATGPHLSAELAEARAERDRLAGELADMRAQCEALRRAADQASTRLDGTIERVRILIGD